MMESHVSRSRFPYFTEYLLSDIEWLRLYRLGVSLYCLEIWHPPTTRRLPRKA